MMGKMLVVDDSVDAVRVLNRSRAASTQSFIGFLEKPPYS
jgi:hypothetical protein